MLQNCKFCASKVTLTYPIYRSIDRDHSDAYYPKHFLSFVFYLGACINTP